MVILKKVKIKIDWVFVCWPRNQFFVTHIEQSPVPTAVYAVDTHLPLVYHWLRGYVQLFDVIFSAQKNLIEDLQKYGHKKSYWLPFAADQKLYAKKNLGEMYW